jgi:hypothetical protein
MDFWDHLTLVTLITVRDYYHDKEKQKQKIGKIYKKCKEEIACAASDLFNAITEVSEKANPNCIPNEIGTGSIILPVYAFAKVLQAQGGIPSSEQKSFLDFYFKNMSVGFSENEFLASMHSNNDTQHKMDALVGISENSAGTFWIAFFKAMYVTKSDESTLSKVADYFSSIVVRFSILGKTQNQVALPICESFIKAIHTQIIKCRKLPENDLDFIGEVPYLEHKQRTTNIAMSLLYAAGEQDGLDLDQMLPIFYISMLYDMVNMTNRNTHDKAGILDYAMKICSIEFEFSGYDIYKHVENGDELGELIGTMSNRMFVIIAGLSGQAHREADGPKFAAECLGFLVGVEKQLSKEYPLSGFGDLARTYITNQTQSLLNLMK